MREAMLQRGRTTIWRARAALSGAASLAVLGLSAGACYSYAPLTSAPAPGTAVSLTVNDAGRLALGPSVGEGVRSLEGVVESVADSGYALRMRSISYVNGQTNAWTGERLTVGPQFISVARQRQFSRKRTAAVAAAGIGGFVAFILSRDLLGSGTDARDPGGGPGSSQ